MKLLENIFLGLKIKKKYLTEGIKKCLKCRMDKIHKSYKEMGVYPYELYTLMCVVANEFDINYTMELHGELINID